jgi:glycine cleavage system H protein
LRAAERECRHNLTGEMPGRLCPLAFDCRECEKHAKFIAKHPPARLEDAEEEIFGMAFPLDRLYHRGHAWMRREANGVVTVGLDDLGRRLLGEPDSVTLPQPGRRVAVNGTAWRARKRNAEVRVLSPVDGEVLETGGPNRGWYLKVKPDNQNTTHLLRPHEVRPWLMREMERLQLALAGEGKAPTLADGGVPVADIAASCPQADWDAVCGEMFLHP